MFSSLRPLALAALAVLGSPFVRAAEPVAPKEAAERVARGEAVLVDVREPNEWTSGVAEPALLIPLSRLREDPKAWQAELAPHQDKEIILYCRTGNRSAQAAALLEKEGFSTGNAGGFSDWEKAGLPTRNP